MTLQKNLPDPGSNPWTSGYQVDTHPTELAGSIWITLLLLFSFILFEPWHDKTNKLSVRPAKTQISLGIRPVWSKYSLCAQWVAKDARFLQADSEDYDQTWRMPRLVCVFAGRTLSLLVLSCRDSLIIHFLKKEKKKQKKKKTPGCSMITVILIAAGIFMDG